MIFTESIIWTCVGNEFTRANVHFIRGDGKSAQKETSWWRPQASQSQVEIEGNLFLVLLICQNSIEYEVIRKFLQGRYTNYRNMRWLQLFSSLSVYDQLSFEERRMFRRNFIHLFRRLFVLLLIVIFCYELLIFYEQKQRKNEKIKELIQEEKIKDRLIHTTSSEVKRPKLVLIIKFTSANICSCLGTTKGQKSWF